MTLPILEEQKEDLSCVVPLTVEQYHQMIANGILREGLPIELLDGVLVWKDRSHGGDDPMTVGHQHAVAVDKINLPNELPTARMLHSHAAAGNTRAKK